MKLDLNKNADSSAQNRQDQPDLARSQQYTSPQLYVIGRSHGLLQGSGRHKNDDTGSRGFIVDQH
jgi:hypothetical protein